MEYIEPAHAYNDGLYRRSFRVGSVAPTPRVTPNPDPGGLFSKPEVTPNKIDDKLAQIQREYATTLKQELYSRQKTEKLRNNSWHGSKHIKADYIRHYKDALLTTNPRQFPGPLYEACRPAIDEDGYLHGTTFCPDRLRKAQEVTQNTGIPFSIFQMHGAISRGNGGNKSDTVRFIYLLESIPLGVDLSMVQFKFKKQFIQYAYNVYKNTLYTGILADEMEDAYHCVLSCLDRILSEGFIEFVGSADLYANVRKTIGLVNKGLPSEACIRFERDLRCSVSKHIIISTPFESAPAFDTFISLIKDSK